jgi:hypothetical protein
MTPDVSVADESGRRPDRLAAALAAGFIVLLLATELVLSLPDEAAPPLSVAAFYTQHRAFIVILQLLGFAAAALFGGYAWRLRSVDRVVSWAGLLTALCALVPGIITLVIAVVANPADPAAAGRWNSLEPRGDDILFIGILMFAAAVAVRLGRGTPMLGLLASVVVLACLARLILEAMRHARGVWESVGPLSFVALVAAMAVLSFRGVLHATDLPILPHRDPQMPNLR